MSDPVSIWDNERAKGLALTCDAIHAQEMAQVDALRQREAQYRACLPTEPKAAIAQAVKILNATADGYPEGFAEAMHLSVALSPLIATLTTDDPGPERDALLWIAGRIALGLYHSRQSLDRAVDTLTRPAEAARGM